MPMGTVKTLSVNAMSNDPVMQHTVPATYLEQFASTVLPKRKSPVWMLNLETGGCKQVPVGKVTMQKDYYTFEDKDGKKDYALEMAFAKLVEGPYKPFVLKIEQGLLLTQQEFSDLLVFVAAQSTRTTKAREFFEQLFSYEVVSKFSAIDDEKVVENADPQLKPEDIREALDAIRSGKVIASPTKNRLILDALQQMRCAYDLFITLNGTFLHAKGSEKFITSDHPLIPDSLSTTGFSLSGRPELIFPLSSNIAFLMHLPNGQRRLLADMGLGDDDVRLVNSIQAGNAHRFLFGADEQQLLQYVNSPKGS